MTITPQNIAVLYEAATGKIIQNIRLPSDLNVNAEVTLSAGEAMLVGQKADDVNAFQVVSGQLIACDPPVGATLEQTKKAAKEEVDRIAGVIRGEVSSEGHGQEMTYLKKETQARAYLAAPVPVDTDYPMLLQEVGITGDTLADVATAVVAKASEWDDLGGAIEAVRLGSKQQIEAATSNEEIQSVMVNIVWPSTQ